MSALNDPTARGNLKAHVQPNALGVEYVSLPDPRDPRTWTVSSGILGDQTITDGLRVLIAALDPAAKVQDLAARVFVQFGTDDLGTHRYVGLGEVHDRISRGTLDAGGPLTVVLEDEIKALRTRLLDSASGGLGRAGDDPIVILMTSISAQQLEASPEASGRSDGEHVDPVVNDDESLCPRMGLWRNYTICEDLTLAPTRRIMLSDESTLRSGVERNGIGIFNYLSLIVNCHETAAANRPGKYSVGRANPELVFQPIHALFRESPERIAAIMHEIQEKIWECSQKGSVAVHCLAGVHRAPTVVVCQYLYRHYVLGKREVLKDVEEIYRRLRRVRSGVEPLSYKQFIDIYQMYLINKYGTGGDAGADATVSI